MTDAAATAPQVVVAAPPRYVPTALGRSLCFGGPVATTGWVLFIAGLAYAAVMYRATRIVEPSGRWSGAVEVPGRVVDVQYARGTERTAHLLAVRYVYVTPDGQTRQGVSFTDNSRHFPGETASVRYLPASPGVSRIAGYSAAPFLSWTDLIVPLLGLGLIVGALRFGVRRLRLLRDGEAVWGIPASATPTGMLVDGRPRYKIDLAYADGAGETRRHVVRTMERDDYPLGKPVLLLCDPQDPQRARRFSDFADVHLTEDGELVADQYVDALVWLLPALVVVVAIVGLSA